METVNQLQLGPVEEDFLQEPSVDVELSEDELDTPLSSAGVVSTFSTPQIGQDLPARGPQLEGTADIVNSLGASRFASMEEMRRAFNEEAHGGPLDEAIYNLSLAEGEARQQRAMQILNRTDLAPEDRIELVKTIERESEIPDVNIVHRNWLSTEAQSEYASKGDDDEAAFEDALEYVANEPRLPRPVITPEAEVSTEEMRQAYEQFLNMVQEDADKRSYIGIETLITPALIADEKVRTGALELLPNLVPFQTAVPVSRIAARLQDVINQFGGKSVAYGRGSTLIGTTLREMRETIETLPVEQKMKFAGEVLRVLKPNGEALRYENAHITAYVWKELFYKDLTGQDRIAVATDEQNKAYFHAKGQADHFARRALHETDLGTKRSYNVQAHEWERKALDISVNSGGRMWDDMNRPTFMQWLDDMAVLDYAGLGWLAKGTIKAGQRYMSGGLRALTRVAPDKATKLAVDMLHDPRVRAKVGDMIGEDVVETFLPKAVKEAEEAGINGIGELLARRERVRQEIGRTRIEGSGVTATQQHAFEDELRATLGQTARATMHQDKSVFTIAEDGVEYVARYGRTESKPFATLSTARKALEDLPEHARVVQMDRATGKYQVVGDAEAATKRGEFYVAYGDKRTYDSSRTMWEEAALPLAQVRDPMLSSSVAPLAKMWNWFLPTDSMFGKDISNEIVGWAMRSPAIMRMHQDLITTLPTLKHGEQMQVAALLKQGEDMGTVFRVEEIKNVFPRASDKTITAYYEARALADEMYSLANSQQRTEWFRSGVKHFANDNGEIGYGKVLSTADAAIGDIKTGYSTLHVYDPDTAQFLTMSRSDIDGLYKKGMTLGRMEDLVQGKGFKEATHTILNGKTTRVRELPRQVLKKRPGYYTHIFKGNHVVYGVSPAGNKVALATAMTVGDAKAEVARIQRIMSRLSRSGKTAPYDPSTITYRFDRSLRDPLVTTKEAADPIFGATSKVYGKRSGYLLRNASKSHGENLVDPIESLLRGMELVSHSVSKGNLVKHMEQRLYNTLRLMEKQTGQRILKDPRKIAKTPDDINYNPAYAKDHRKVLAYMQQIDMVRHIPDAVERNIATGLVWASELFDNVAAKIAKLPLPGAKSVSADVDRLGGKLVSAATRGVDPTRLMTEIAHRVYIASNPIQQFALQMSQALMLTGIAPIDLPVAVGRTVPFLTLLYSRAYNATPEAYERVLSIAAKATGMKTSEVKQVVGVLERSGLIDSVSMHTQIRTTARSQAHMRELATASAANRNSIGRKFMEGLQKVDEQTYGRLSQMGFEAGETNNRVVTFLTLYGRDKRKGIADLSSPAYIQNIVGETNTLVGSMLRETSMGYQRGWLKAAFQFVAFQHKMAALSLTNKTLTPKQRIGIAASQFLLFGSRGAFHLDAARRAFDKWIVNYEASSPDEKSKMVELYYAPETQSVLDGIVFDWGVNELVRTVGGKDTPDFAWNERIAPGGGSELMTQTLMEMINNPTEKVFGLGGNLAHPVDAYDVIRGENPRYGSKLMKFFDQARKVTLAQSKDMDDVPVEERMKMLAKEGLAGAFSGYDKYLTAAAAQKMGGWITATGNVVDGTDSELEYFFSSALGLTTEDRQAWYDASDLIYGETRNNKKKHEDTLDLIANQFFQRQVAEATKFSGSTFNEDVYIEMQGKLQQNQAFLLSFLAPREQEYVSEKIGEQLKELVDNRKDSAQEVFYRNLTRELESTGMGNKDVLELGVYLKHSPLFATYPQLQSDWQQKWREITEYEEEQ
jgi:hypothetical protein